MASEDDPGRALLTALGAMLGVALLVGLAIGGMLVVVTRVAGLGTAAGTADQAQQTLYMPKYHPTKAAQENLGLPNYKPSPTPTVGLPGASPSPASRRITLFAAPQSVSPGERINLNGVYNGAEGAALQIQRKEGGAWSNFPVTATVRGGVFETWIQTTHTGAARFRVLDAKTGKASNVVIVKIG